MAVFITFANRAQDILDKIKNSFDFIAPVLLRIYLVPVFWVAGKNKWDPFDRDSSLDGIVQWFGNPEWGLGLPFPGLMAYLAWGAEYLGAICLALGLAVRWVSIPLMVTMVVAATSVHWHNGWQAVHDLMSPHATANTGEAIERLSRAREILREHGHYEWLTEHGNFVVSNNGIEWAATYFVMLVALFFFGGGRYLSIDYWLARRFRVKAA